ncbi:hypothetical protein ACFS5M_13960 [Lacinutrix iliipiscaria]|uniref:Uncharacterized protein n=1 Tax=Lacinutrix iliipiscaria TaxID=1230532 RepID=A0ABW5WU18_9FLAO
MKKLILLTIVLLSITSYSQTLQERVSELETKTIRMDNDYSLLWNLVNQRLKVQDETLDLFSKKIDSLEAKLDAHENGSPDPEPEPPTNDFSYPDQVNASSYNWGTLNPPAPSSNLGYLQEIPDEKTGAVIRRLAPDNTIFTVKYAKNTAYNSNGKLIKASSANGTAIIDAESGDFLYYVQAPNFGNWSNTNPDLMYGITNGTNQWKELKVSTNTTKVIRTFTGYSNLSIGEGEGRISLDDKYVVLIGYKSSKKYLIVYNIKDDVIEGEQEINASGDLDWATITPSGEYVVLSWRPEGTSETQGLKAYNRDFSNYRHLYWITAHADIGTDFEGNDVYLSVPGQSSITMAMVRIHDGLVVESNKIKISCGHISTANTKRPGYAYVSESCSPSSGISTDVFTVKLDYQFNFEKVEPFGKTYAIGVSGTTSSPMFCPNRTGTEGVFNSYMNNDRYKSMYSGYAPIHQLKIPQD